MIKLYADYHTHTIYSHGKGTIMDNVLAAKEKGLKEIAITDHGIRHFRFGVKRDNLKKMRREIDVINDGNTGVKVLLGMECNIISSEGDVDVDEDILKQLDILLVGYHLMVKPKKLSDVGDIYGRNLMAKMLSVYKEETKEANTKAIIKAIHKYKIDIITHPGARIPIDTTKVAAEAVKVGTAMEINSAAGYLKVEQAIAAAKQGAKFAIDSDAHTPQNVANFSLGIKIAEAAGITSEQIINAIKQ